MYAYLCTTYSVHIPPMVDFLYIGKFLPRLISGHIFPNIWHILYKYNLFMTRVIFMEYFVLFSSPLLTLLVWCFFCTYPLYDLFCTHTSSWPRFLYIRKSLTEFLDIHLPFELNSISATSSWPRLYTSDFYDYFVYLLLLGELIFTYGWYVYTYWWLFSTCTFSW